MHSIIGLGLKGFLVSSHVISRPHTQISSCLPAAKVALHQLSRANTCLSTKLIASAVVLGLSVTLENHQKYGSPPAETSFASFTGGFGIVVAAIGVASMFIDAIPTLVPLVVEGLAALFFLAGGIVSHLFFSCSGCAPFFNCCLRVYWQVWRACSSYVLTIYMSGTGYCYERRFL